MPHITCQNLVKVFGGTRPVRALDGLTISVDEGEVYGILGPNGSGKTTFVRCCMNIIFPTSGKLEVLGRRPGHPISASKIGYLPENANFYDHLTGRQFLKYHSELAGIPLREHRSRINDILEKVKLTPEASHRRLRTYSKGMLQRVGLAQALIGKPDILFLDEPQTGLDPIGRRQIKDVMRDAAASGTTVLFSSHVLGDVEEVADKVAIIDRGKLRKVANLSDLTEKLNKIHVRLSSDSSSRIPDTQLEASIISAFSGAEIPVWNIRDAIATFEYNSENDIPFVVEHLVKAGLKVYGVEKGHQSLEEVFLEEFGELNLGGPTTSRTDAAEIPGI